MALAEQMISLVKSYIQKDDDQFTSVAYQLAAHEAKNGHTKIAQEIKKLIEKAQKEKPLEIKNF